MSIEDQRVTLDEAAVLAGVSRRTINRWAARGRLEVRHSTTDRGVPLPATVDRDDVIRLALTPATDLPLPEPETDISG